MTPPDRQAIGPVSLVSTQRSEPSPGDSKKILFQNKLRNQAHRSEMHCTEEASSGLVAIMEKASAGQWSLYKEALHLASCSSLSFSDSGRRSEREIATERAGEPTDPGRCECSLVLSAQGSGEVAFCFKAYVAETSEPFPCFSFDADRMRLVDLVSTLEFPKKARKRKSEPATHSHIICSLHMLVSTYVCMHVCGGM